ncbi:hypothetical protein Adt_05630 [Abeliophyllum distichum]|uniref:Uncharacterized protein n=1 Tax=Abeliophyllum distichum TaxID=126358 RepID=A0ABD1V4N2_9LAMI
MKGLWLSKRVRRANEETWNGYYNLQSIWDWFGHDVDQCQPDVGKLQPKRSHKPTSTATSKPLPFEFHFMPTLGIIPTNSNLYNKNGSAPDVHPTGMKNTGASHQINEIQTHSFSFNNMVDDIQQIDEGEQVRMKSKRAKNRRIVRG